MGWSAPSLGTRVYVSAAMRASFREAVGVLAADALA